MQLQHIRSGGDIGQAFVGAFAAPGARYTAGPPSLYATPYVEGEKVLRDEFREKALFREVW